MLEFDVDVDDNDLIKRLDNFEETFEQEARTTLELILAFVDRIIRPLIPVGATGFLRNSLFTSIRGRGVDLRGRIAMNATYAGSVESGTKPHMPPVDAILLWVKRVLQISDEKQAKQTAWAIAKKIKREGTKGKGIFDRSKKQFRLIDSFVNKQSEALTVKMADFIDKG